MLATALPVLGDWNVQLRPEVLAKTNLIPVTSSCTQLHYGGQHGAGVRIVYIAQKYNKVNSATPILR